MIEVQALTKRYGAVTAIDNLSFTAQPGQVTGFLGPNGAGKTTTMRILTGFMPPTSGTAIVAGYDVFTQSMEVRRRIGYLPENVPLYRDMTAIGYLMYLAEIRGLDDRRKKAEAALDRVGLLYRAKSRIRSLSKGMRQRVGLAAALLHDPEVLILDEPTIGLDPFQVLELRDLIRELGEDHTVLFSTHILSEAEQVCNNVVIINQGHIVAQGNPVDLRVELERGGRIFVRVDANLEDVQPIIASADGVASVDIEGDHLIATPSSANVDPRPAIARALIEANYDLVELRPLAVRLEEIFLEVTQRQVQHPEEEPEAEVVG